MLNKHCCLPIENGWFAWWRIKICYRNQCFSQNCIFDCSMRSGVGGPNHSMNTNRTDRRRRAAEAERECALLSWFCESPDADCSPWLLLAVLELEAFATGSGHACCSCAFPTQSAPPMAGTGLLQPRVRVLLVLNAGTVGQADHELQPETKQKHTMPDS